MAMANFTRFYPSCAQDTGPAHGAEKRGGRKPPPLIRVFLASEQEIRRDQGRNPAQLDLEIRCRIAIHIAPDDHIRSVIAASRWSQALAEAVLPSRTTRQLTTRSHALQQTSQVLLQVKS